MKNSSQKYVNSLIMVGFLAFFSALLLPSNTLAANELLVAPATALTDNLIGATNTQWRFTATTTADLAPGDAVQLVFPNVTNPSQSFSLQDLTVATSSNITLYSSMDPLTEGVITGLDNRTVGGIINAPVTASTVISITLSGASNAIGQLSSLSDLAWTMKAGTPVGSPVDDLSVTKFTFTDQVGLTRAGGALVSDENSNITVSSYATSTAANYTFSIKASTSIPIGGKIVINFPVEISLNSATVAEQTIASGGATVATGAIATSTQGGNMAKLTVSGAPVEAGEVISVIIGGLTNPSTADVYRPFYVFTTKSNDGLIDGSYRGFEQSDYGSGSPPPVDAVHIGGTNTLVVQVKKQSGGSTVNLSVGERALVKVAAGCPDKQFFVGERWLDSNSTARYENILDCNYIVGTMPFDKSDNSFYNTFLSPGMKAVPTVGGTISTSTLVFGIPNATSTITLTGGVSGQQAFVQAFSADFETFGEVFTDTNYTTPGFHSSGNGYVRLRTKSGSTWNFNLMGGQYGNAENISDGSGNKYWPPAISSYIPTANATTNVGTFAYVLADKTLNVSLLKTGSAQAVTNACVGVKRSGGGLFMPSQDVICSPNNGNNYQFKVPIGTITIEVMRMGKSEEFSIAISEATTNKTIYLSAPTSYISVTIQNSAGVAINGAPVFAHGSNGFAHEMTNTSGQATLYVSPGTYVVEGFAPALGQLTAQTAVVTTGSNPSVTFSINLGSLKTISGTVTQSGSPIVGMKIGARGTGSTTGGNGTETDASGQYTLYVPAGTYEVGGWSPSTGGLSPQQVNVSSANATGVNWTLAASGNLTITIQNASDLNQLFAGAFDPLTGRGNGTNAWTISGTSKTATITLPAGTYDVQAGSPAIGEIGHQTEVAIAAGETTTVTFNASASKTLVVLSGAVTLDGSPVANVNVWASRIGGPGFFSTQTNSSGEYTFTLPDERVYKIGLKSLVYIANEGDVSVTMSGNETQNFTLTSAGATISGTITSGSSAIPNAWVSAKKTIGDTEVWTGTLTDAAGTYSLTVDSGSTWTVYVEGPCYYQTAGASYSAGVSNADISLTAISGCTAPTPQINGITAASGGQVAKDDIILDIPANALGTGNSTVSVSISDAPLAITTSNATPLKNSVQRILATDSTGSSISSLNTNVSLSITYNESDLPVGFDESTLQLAYFDSTSGQWEPVEATVDTTNNKLIAQVDHFTDYGPILPGVPDAPTGLSATAASASQINLSWSASATATSYKVYRSLTNSNFTTAIASGITSTSYSDTGLTAATTYYYKVAGVNANGEGPNSSSANATTSAAPSAGGGIYGPVNSISSSQQTLIINATSTISSASTTSTTATIVATTNNVSVTDTTIPSGASEINSLQARILSLLEQLNSLRQQLNLPPITLNAAISASPAKTLTFTRRLILQDVGDGVRQLQTKLKELGFFKHPSITGYFGPVTKQAVIEFQKSKGIDPIGIVGPKTRAALNSL